MRLLRLDLERYGPFTDRSLAFRPDAKLHIVHGANEAGKSSALAAIDDLLYGFEARSPANFLHRYEDLRVGAHLLGPDGRGLAIRRRKGNQRTLVDTEDRPLDDGLLAPLLGGVGREAFRRAFGLSQEGLRAGARLLMDPDADSGTALFAAATGLRDLLGTRAALEAEAEALFGARRAAGKPFYRVLDQHGAAHAALQQATLRGEALRAFDDAVAAQDRRASEIADRLGVLAASRARLARARRVWPPLRRLADAAAETAALGPLPDAPPDLAERIEAALAARAAAEQDIERLSSEVETGRTALGGIVVDAALLDAADDIAGLARTGIELAKALDDLPRRRAELAGTLDVVEGLTRRLGLDGRAALEASLPSALVQAGLRDLAGRQALAEAALADARRRAAAAERGAEALAPAATDIPAAAEAGPLRRRLQALRPAIAAAAALPAQRADLARRRTSLAERLKRLSPAPAGGEAVFAAPLPPDEAVAAFAARFDALAAEAAAHRAEDERLTAALAGAERDLAAPQIGEAVTLQAVTEARLARDAEIARFAEAPTPPQAIRLADAVSQADRLADRRFAAADASLRREEALGRREAARRALDALKAKADALAEARVRLEAEWEAAFHAAGIVPGRPAAMTRWLGEVAALREERAALATLESGVEAAEAAAARERPALDALAREAGIAGETADRGEETLAREIEVALADLDQQALDGRARAERALQAARALAAAREETAAREADLAGLAQEAEGALAPLGLAGAGWAVPRAALDVWREAEAKLPLLARIEHTVASIEADRAAFAGRAEALAARLSRQSSEPQAFAARIAQELDAARAAQARRLDAEAALGRLDAALLAAQRVQAEATARLDALGAEAGAPLAGLADLVQRLRRALAIEAERRTWQAELAQLGDGLDEAMLVAETAGLDPDAAAAEEARIDAEMAALAEEDKRLAAERGESRRRREALETQGAAAAALQRREDAAAELDRIARDYLRLKAASALIGAAIERRRRTEEAPLVARAGALFARMTEGAFAGIAVDYGEDDVPRLAARRADGKILKAEDALSEGTRDQFFLALRLAALGAAAQAGSVPPFVGDDLVITFDEDRVAAALDALAEAGEGLQVILFTHHRHVPEIAARRLGARADIIALSPQR